ncbi:MAG: peptidase sortase [Marmoricola sp.]|jgi:sortase A|nr:peptidase sortase [Marmoricola sp.]
MTTLAFLGSGSRKRPVTRTAIRAGEPAETIAVTSSAFLMLALVSLWFVLQALALGGLSEHRSQALLYSSFRQELAAATAPTGGVITPGTPVALVSIPALGVEQVVVEGTASGDLLAGPGHLRSTPLPGQAGISVVFGRASTYGAPFSEITSLRVGDEVVAQNGQGSVTYHVADIRRAGDPFPAAPTGTQGRLTLVTAEGSGAFSALRPSAAVYVDATADKALPAPGGLPAGVPASEQVMASDTGALPMLVLCLALLVALTLGVSAARQRWSTALVWVIAAPVAIALSWSTSDVVMRLLPNLM